MKGKGSAAGPTVVAWCTRIFIHSLLLQPRSLSCYTETRKPSPLKTSPWQKPCWPSQNSDTQDSLYCIHVKQTSLYRKIHQINDFRFSFFDNIFKFWTCTHAPRNLLLKIIAQYVIIVLLSMVDNFCQVIQ